MSKKKKKNADSIKQKNIQEKENKSRNEITEETKSTILADLAEERKAESESAGKAKKTAVTDVVKAERTAAADTAEEKETLAGIGEEIEIMLDNEEKKKSVLTSAMKKRILFIGCSAAGVLLLVYLGFAFFFYSHFTFGTKINGVACSGKTIEQAEKKILKQVENYKMHITGREGFETEINGKDIDLMVIFDGELEKVKKKQNPFAWIVSLFSRKEETVGNVVHFNEESLTKQFEDMACLDNPDAEEPVSASLVYEKDAFQIVPEKEGTVVDKEAFRKALWDGIENLEEEFSMVEKDCYKQPALVSDSEKLLKAQETMNGYLKVNITYSFGDSKETVNKDKISGWISMNEAAEVVFDEAAVRAYIDTLGDKYNTYGKKRSFQTSYNQVVEITKGHYGWRLNRADETLALIEDIKAGASKEKEPLYISRAAQYGENDIGNTYVEINLTAQRVFLYKDGNLVVETDCVTGKLTKDRITPEGIDSITYKDKDAVLRGADYASPVKFWMPFNGNVGLHDASWRNKFGGSIYKNNGSHGCVNLPYAAAKKIFENVEAGTPVIVYSLPGTERPSQDILTPEEEAAAAAEGSGDITYPIYPSTAPNPTQAPAAPPATTAPPTQAPTTAPPTAPPVTTVPPTSKETSSSASGTKPSSSETGGQQQDGEKTKAAQRTEREQMKKAKKR